MALISVTISGNAAPLKKAIGEAEGSLGGFGSSAKKFGLAAAAGIAAAGAAAAVVGKQLIAAGEQASTSNARIEQIAKSMGLFGEATEQVSNRLVKLAEKTALQTGVDQNAIKLTQAKLLTFVDLAKTADTVGGSFDRATQAAIDLAAAGFGEASQNAVQLGKALQDPIKGITALARSGVTFTEVEKERIQTLVDSNKLGEAQTLILEAIEKQVGGTANATANASDKMRVAFSQLQERLGSVLLPIFERFTRFLIDDVFPMLQRLGDKFLPVVSDAFAKVGDFIADKVVPVVRDYLLPLFQRLTSFFVEKVVPVVTNLWQTVFRGLANIFETVSEKIRENQDTVRRVTEFFRTLATFIVEKVAPILTKTLGVAFGVVSKAIGPVIDVVFRLMDAFASLGTFLIKVATSVLDTVEGMVNGVIRIINKAIDAANKINPFSDIPNVPEVNLGIPSLGGTPSVPGGTSSSSGADRVERMFGGAGAALPTFTEPSLVPGTTSGGGGGGGGGGGAKAGTAVDMTGFIGITPSTDIFGGGGGGFGAAMGNEALLDGLTGGTSVSIVVNTVSADANLPNLIVDALQQYNLVSGPIDVAIAV